MVVITSPRGSGSLRELPGTLDGLDLLVHLDQEKTELRREKIPSEDSKHILKSRDMCNMVLTQFIYRASPVKQSQCSSSSSPPWLPS